MFGAPDNHPNGVLPSKQALEVPIIDKKVRCGEEGWLESTVWMFYSWVTMMESLSRHQQKQRNGTEIDRKDQGGRSMQMCRIE
mmetsp:Transcript_7631/g.11763  ORF Transcript_7631/g.11763 Transcript_7631/m.11763 type:complete len:83 (-) Transcript_7631:1097-1345(-)